MTEPTKWLYLAVMAQLVVPILVLMLNGKRKMDQRRVGKVDPQSVVDNKAWDLPVVLTSNSLANQFQLPVLFYVLCLVLIQIGRISFLALALAWLFVLLRWVHAYVHVTSNFIPLRFGSFIASSLVLLVLFIHTFVLVVGL